MLNATWLETFVTLAEEASFTRTAARLNMTQPGVSQHLAKLEAAVGVPLVQRIGKTIVLTDAGNALRDHARVRQAEELALLERIGEDRPDVGAVGIGASGSFATVLYRRLLPHLVAARELIVTLEAAPQSRVIEAVAAGRLDLGVVSRDPRQTRLEAEKIGVENLCLALPSGAGSTTPDLEELQDMGFVDHPDGAAYAEMVMPENFDGFQSAQALRRRGFVNQISQIPALVAAGAGYTILPRSGIDGFAGSASLQIAALRHPVHQELWLIRRAGRLLPTRCLWAMAEIRSLAEELYAPSA
ncbi:LysR family transcriptional regulator [uncultured Roseibium sp.]|uniref:LysR family transcriptional regulator n=1 Tax=uncultured Roseibium sp. TaxID=1936171 RepID=UPI0025997E95|nr:LysR family transcriptional regulator [uncultured Roseibium sp.]